MTVIVFGSINVDIALQVDHLPVPGETVLTGGYEVVPGGKGCNQAVAAGKLGADVRMVGAIGDDAWASIPMQAMEAAGVDTQDVRIVGSPTALAAVMVADDGENSIIVASGANKEVRATQLSDVRADDVLVCQMEVLFDETADALLKAKAAGATTVLNLAPFGLLPERARGAVDYWLVNALEGEALAGEVELPAFFDPGSVAGRLAERMGATVIMTLGGEGAIAVDPKGSGCQVSALPVDIVDTTGAGDAFTGGFAAALARGDDLMTAMKLATAAAGLACTGFGAQTSQPDLEAVERVLDRIAVSAL